MGASTTLMTLMAVTAWLGAVGTIRYVRGTSCSPTGPGTPASPYCKIQDAICASASGDEVRVLPGTYNEAVRMRPGVNLLAWLPDDPNNIGVGAVNTDPNQTVVTSNNQPCNNTDFCTKRAGNQCTVVTISSGFTTATRIEGFKLTGGKGRPPLAGDPQFVGGGGMYVFSSPTILNNVITNNILAGPPHDLRGAGIYIGAGNPIISGNVIVGNRAVPPAGTTSNTTYGYGGGIWSSFASAPTITGNVIQSNVAGDPNIVFSLGEGGGLVIYTGATAGAVLDRNLIADNQSDTLAGGLGLDLSGPGGALAVVSNNVIVGNASKNGGGVSVYLTRANIVNNTITTNEALVGGGLHLGRGDITIPVSITNNIIESNILRMFGDGGGIYTHDLDPPSDPTIQYNLLWGNQRNQISGDRTDANTIGVSGNFSTDPMYVDRPGRNFHLASGSPAIDRALAGMAPAVDFDNMGRGVDGNGLPNDPQPGDVDVGAFEAVPTCVPVAETCNGLDDSCNGMIDEGFPNTDGDAQADCVDPDDDNDGAADGSDCAPLDTTAFGVPTEVDLTDVQGTAPTVLTYVPQGIGSGTHYEVIGGLLSRVLARGDFQETFCLPGAVTGGSYDDTRANPPPGDAWYYLIRSANACGVGTFGSSLADAPGAGDVCPQNVVDADADGSPSDVDCNDANPAISPLAPDLCNGISDDCDAEVDEDFLPQETTCGVGACQSTGSSTCVGGVPGDTCAPGAPGPSDAICDGVDDNCNGTPDEQYASQPTTCGVGACQSSGATSCVQGLERDSCEPGTPAPADATCNGVDDNCNGSADEEFVSQPTMCGVGACQRSGATSCVGGSLSDSCVPGSPSTEMCDSVDNDCDTEIDNGFTLGQACSGQTGTCQGNGVTVCDPDGASTTCSAAGILLTADLVEGSPVLEWNAFPGVAAYDVLRGSLSQLAGTSGDFTTSLLECIANDLPATSLGEPGLPPEGDGYWYLLRGSSCGSGGYESNDPGQVGLRGPEIQASGQSCP